MLCTLTNVRENSERYVELKDKKKIHTSLDIQTLQNLLPMANFRAKNIEHKRRSGKHEEVVRKK